MATTRLIAMHITKGNNAAQALADRIEYAVNPAKTESGQLVTSYACDWKTAANEFALMRSTYLHLTQRYRDGEVIAY